MRDFAAVEQLQNSQNAELHSSNVADDDDQAYWAAGEFGTSQRRGEGQPWSWFETIVVWVVAIGFCGIIVPPLWMIELRSVCI